MSALESITKLIKESQGIITAADAERVGVSRTTLSTLAAKGDIERVARGQYSLPDSLPDELYVWQSRNGSLIYSHETALFLLDMAERTPLLHSVTLPSTRKLSLTFPARLKVYYVKPELHDLGKVMVPSKFGHEIYSYNAERTICDIVRSRNRIDDQIVTAALKNYVARADKDLGVLAHYADAFRITKIIRSYMEILL